MKRRTSQTPKGILGQKAGASRVRKLKQAQRQGWGESFNITDTDGQQSRAQLTAVQADETFPKRVLIYGSGCIINRQQGGNGTLRENGNKTVLRSHKQGRGFPPSLHQVTAAFPLTGSVGA